SRNMFAGQGIQAAEAVRMIREGLAPSDIGARLKQLGDLTYTYLVPADLHNIYKRASKKGDRSLSWGGYALGTVLDVKPILRCHRDETGPVAKVRGFEAGVEKLFDNLAAQVEKGLAAPTVCLSYGGEPDEVRSMPGYRRFARLAVDRDIQILVSAMSKTAAVNVGPGALAAAFAASDPVLP
ncbi:MAG: DegV family protein, partial [Actinomycetota bacterium]